MMLKFFTILAVGCSLPSLAWAQDEQASPGTVSQAAQGGAPQGIADIIVTAEKRSTSLQRTPIAVTAISGEALQRAQVRTLLDIPALVPSFQMGDLNGYAQITVRGIGISNFVPGSESAVALNMNEVYISRPIAQLTGLFDVSALEVLRGPQGTLYGRNATAGAVNITTNRPTDDWSGYTNMTFGNYGQFRVEGAAGGPIIRDRLLVRIAGFRETRDGYGKNLFTGHEIDDKRAYALRGTVVFRPTENFEATVIGEYYKQQDRSSSYHYFGAGGLTGLPGALGLPPFFILLGGTPPANRRDIDTTVDPMFRLRTSAVTGIMEWKSGPFSLKSITGYRDQSSLTQTEVSGGNLGGGYFIAGEPAHQFSQELQANYNSSKLNVTVGAFYFKEHDDYSPATIPVGNNYLNLVFPDLPQRPVPGYTYFGEIGGLTKTRAKAVFAQATYHLTDALSLTAGIRYGTERKQLFQRYVIDLYTPYVTYLPRPAATEIPARTFKSTTPKFGIQYQIDPRTLLYLTFAKGFKSGGFDAGTDPSLVGRGFRPEKLTDYEGGIKTTFLDNKLRLNLSGFYYDYTDLQVPQSLGVNQVLTSNAGTARVYGAELELSAIVTPELTIDANGSWTHARYTAFVGPDVVLPLLTAIDFKGNRLNNAPDYRAHLAATYTKPLGAGAIVLKAEGDYTSKFYFSPANLPLVGQDAFVKANAFVTYNANAGWHVTAFMRNITNKTTRTAAIANGILFGSPVQGSYAPPRTYGIEIGYKF